MVIYMKYVWFGICLFFILGLFFFDSENNKAYIPVFIEEIDETEIRYISVKTEGLTTKNFANFLDLDLVTAIYPKINPLYSNKLKISPFVCNQNCNINDMETYYKKILESNNFKYDSVLIDYQGVIIDRVILYVNSKQLGTILKKCPICTVK